MNKYSKIKRLLWQLIVVLPLFLSSFVLHLPNAVNDEPEWQQGILDSMSLEQKIGQLFMVAAYSNKDQAHVDEIEKLVSDYHIGGLIFFQGTPKKQLELTNYYQDLAKTPLLIGIDGEWGLNMRLDGTRKYPYQMTLGGLKADSLIYKMGQEIGEDCNAMGIHINFAPVADVNNNPNNPIINFRSFGEDKWKVANYAAAYALGMQDKKVLSCAKHFPGHGDTETDSHKGLPTINHSKERLDSIELLPFVHLFSKGVASTMVAHIKIPAYDNRPNRAASISKPIVTDLLKKKLNFKGLIFTDALNMKGVANYFPPGELDLLAFEAGNDVLLFPGNVPSAINKFKAALKSGRITMEELDARVLKILKYKNWAGLSKYTAPNKAKLDSVLNRKSPEILIHNIAEDALCLLRNKHFVPMSKDQNSVAIVAIGDSEKNLVKDLGDFKHDKIFYLSKRPSAKQVTNLKASLKKYKKVVVTLHKPKVWSNKSFGFSQTVFTFVRSLGKQENVMVIPFSNPYILKNFQSVKNVLIGFEDEKPYREAAFKVLKGDLRARGVLPVSIGNYKLGDGIAMNPKGDLRMESASLSSQNMRENLPQKLEPILEDLVSVGAAPGGQLLVVKNGNVVYENAFGYHTYSKKQKVKNTDLYDLASITKVAATTISIMKLHEEGKLSINDPIGKHLPFLRGSDKENIIIRDIMLHQARLKSWIPFYMGTLPFRDLIYSDKDSGAKRILVADNLYGDTILKSSLLDQIKKSPLYPRKRYKYSDLGFILLKFVVENHSKMPFNEYVEKTFYEPLGLKHTTYKPLEKFDRNQIVPTENDTLFRRQVIRGYVHDPASAMFGGVAGHAGLFSNARELAVIFQMLLNRGVYKGVRIFKSSTVSYFTACHGLNSRRGIGFDKRENSSSRINPTADECSLLTFGHTGFTGTCVWADPKHDLIFIFLSNRVYPDQENKKLIRGNYRTELQKRVYQSIMD